MDMFPNRSAYVRSPWQFQVRDNPVPPPGPGQLLVRIHACGICGTDQHIADRTASDWQPFGHEVAGVVEATGPGVESFQPGDRVALDSSAPCGQCAACAPPPRGRARPDLCASPVNYWLTATMGFGQRLLAPQGLAVHVPDSVPLDIASLVEPLGVCIDLVQTAQVTRGDHVLVIGPGPLGLGAVFLAARAGAERVTLAGRSSSSARMEAGLQLGADGLIEVDRRTVAETDFGKRRPDKILVTAPPDAIPEALSVAALGGIVSYIGVAWNEKTRVAIDADDLHFRKLSLRPSHAWPGTHATESIRLLAQCPELGRTLVSHRFGLDDIASAMTTVRDDRKSVRKALVVMPDA
jgi:L-iditol 2-dehydrogenase